MGCRECGSMHHNQRATRKETTCKGHVLGVIYMHGMKIGQGTPGVDDPRDWAHESAPSSHPALDALRQGSLTH